MKKKNNLFITRTIYLLCKISILSDQLPWIVNGLMYAWEDRGIMSDIVTHSLKLTFCKQNITVSKGRW